MDRNWVRRMRVALAKMLLCNIESDIQDEESLTRGVLTSTELVGNENGGVIKETWFVSRCVWWNPRNWRWINDHSIVYDPGWLWLNGKYGSKYDDGIAAVSCEDKEVEGKHG